MSNLNSEALILYSGIIRNLVKMLHKNGVSGYASLYDEDGDIVLTTNKGTMIVKNNNRDYLATIDIDLDNYRRLRYFIMATILDLTKKVDYPVDIIEFCISPSFSVAMMEVINDKVKIILK